MRHTGQSRTEPLHPRGRSRPRHRTSHTPMKAPNDFRKRETLAVAQGLHRLTQPGALVANTQRLAELFFSAAPAASPPPARSTPAPGRRQPSAFQFQLVPSSGVAARANRARGRQSQLWSRSSPVTQLCFVFSYVHSLTCSTWNTSITCNWSILFRYARGAERREAHHCEALESRSPTGGQLPATSRK